MNIPKLDERLLAAASFARAGRRVLDVGTDHGYLPAYLVGKKISVSAVASDVREGPLENARRTIASFGMADKITAVLSNGLDALPERCADDVILAGMGGLLIEEILSRAEWIKSDGIRIIAQPMSHPEAVRRFLCANGFEIAGEKAVTDGKRFYCVIAADFTGRKQAYSKSRYFFGTLRESDGSEAMGYLSVQYRRLKKRYDAVKDNSAYKDEAAELCEILTEYDAERRK